MNCTIEDLRGKLVTSIDLPHAFSADVADILEEHGFESEPCDRHEVGWYRDGLISAKEQKKLTKKLAAVLLQFFTTDGNGDYYDNDGKLITY